MKAYKKTAVTMFSVLVLLFAVILAECMGGDEGEKEIRGGSLSFCQI